tara:strand:- start:464 stop:778 length:315 start_codon:yes stop_codon:yes gene_type:complete
VLPVVLERKTWSDLHASIYEVNPRFESQKQKMLRCGLPLKVYLVEGEHVKCGWKGVPGGDVAYAADLFARLDELACLRGFHVVLTHNHHKTIVILSAPSPPSNL